MTSQEVCTLAVNIVSNLYGDTTYRMGNTDPVDTPYNNMTWYNGAWRSDCLGFVRAVLCDWAGDKDVWYGGSLIMGYQCKMFNEVMFVDSCHDENNNPTHYDDFTDLYLHPCSLLYKKDPWEHVGLYVGDYELDGHIYNVCECTSWYGADYINGCKPTWVDPDGTRRYYKDGDVLGSVWKTWGIFNLNGTDYDLTEYNGGASGSTGFGSALSKAEVEKYFPMYIDKEWLTYSYLEALADRFYGMDSDYFRVFAGYVYGENPVGFDDYMLYLDSCIPVNMFMAYGLDTAQKLSDFWHLHDPENYYTLSALTGRGNALEADTTTLAGKRTRVGIYLALLNPNQEAYECVGTGVYTHEQIEDRIIYTQYDVPVWGGTIDEQWALKDGDGVRTYDITGSGIRGEIPVPGSRGRKTPTWMFLRAPQLYRR